MTYVFARNLPSSLLLIQLLSNILRQTANDIRLDGSKTADSRRTGLASHGTDSLSERGCVRNVTIISQLSVVQISLEDDEVRFVEVEEHVRSLRVQIPEGVTGAPEGMLLVPPLALLLILLPPSSHQTKLVHVGFGSLAEQVAVNARVQEPVR